MKHYHWFILGLVVMLGFLYILSRKGQMVSR